MPKFDKQINSVKYDKFDSQTWDDVLFDMNQLKENQDSLYNCYSFVPDEFQDLFMHMYKSAPLMWGKEDMEDTHIFNHSISETFRSLDEIPELRLSTKYDEYAAGFALITMQDTIEELYKQNQELMDLIEFLKDLIEAAMKASPEEQAAFAQDITTVKELIGDNIPEDLKDILSKAVQEAKSQLQDEENLNKSFGLDPGQLKRMDFNERRKLAEQLKTARMRKFAELVGAFKLVSRSARKRRTNDVPDEIVSLELGQDVTRLTAFSLSGLCVPELADKFWLDYTNHSLIQTKVNGPAPLGKGPVIVVCDESGSMSEPAWGGTRESWSKAFCLALCDQARRGHRDFTYIGFSSYGQQYQINFKKGRVIADKLVEFATHFFNEGTAPGPALLMTLNAVRSYPRNNRPDVVIISDGAFGRLDTQFMAQWDTIKKDTRMGVYGIIFDCGPGELSQLVDECISLNSITASPEQIKSIFKALDK